MHSLTYLVHMIISEGGYYGLILQRKKLKISEITQGLRATKFEGRIRTHVKAPAIFLLLGCKLTALSVSPCLRWTAQPAWLHKAALFVCIPRVNSLTSIFVPHLETTTDGDQSRA